MFLCVNFQKQVMSGVGKYPEAARGCFGARYAHILQVSFHSTQPRSMRAATRYDTSPSDPDKQDPMGGIIFGEPRHE